MAAETKIIAMIPQRSGWEGDITVTINNDAANSKCSVSAVMNVRSSSMNIEGQYYFNVYISVDGVRKAVTEDSCDIYMYDSKYTCSTGIFSYADSCEITVGGWATAYSGALAGSSIEGGASWTVEAHRPPTPIETDKSSVQMGKNLMITLNRAYGDYTHTLYYKFGTGSETVLASNVGTSYAWAVPDLAAYCNNAVSGTCTLRAITYQGSAKIGETSKTITLTVQDPTTPSVPNSQVTMGDNCTVTCKRNASNFTIRLKYIFYDLEVSINEGKVDTVTWKPEYDLAKQIPTLTYGTGTLECTTLNGTAVVGTKTITVRTIVPENDTTRPSLLASDVKLSPVSSLGEIFDGLYIRGKTGLRAEITASSEYSTIKTYSVTAGGVGAAGNPATISMLVNEGNVAVTVRVTDARGFSKTVSLTIYVYPYRRPKVVPYAGYSEVICERAKESGELSPNGTYLALKVGKSFSTITPAGSNLNPCRLQYRYKISSADSFGDWITILEEGSTEQEKSLLISGIVSSLATSYDVEIQASDALGEVHTLRFAIMTEHVSFMLYDGVDGAGFGKRPEEAHVVDIASHMKLRVRGTLIVDSAGWKSLGYAGDVNESAYILGRYESSGCHYYVDNGNHVYVAFNAAFIFAGTPVIINETAIPEERRPLRPVYALCPVNDRGMAMVGVDPDGFVRVEWVQILIDTVLTGSMEVTWIDGYLDYWV